jgi:hypothetical protein
MEPRSPKAGVVKIRVQEKEFMINKTTKPNNRWFHAVFSIRSVIVFLTLGVAMAIAVATIPVSVIYQQEALSSLAYQLEDQVVSVVISKIDHYLSWVTDSLQAAEDLIFLLE